MDREAKKALGQWVIGFIESALVPSPVGNEKEKKCCVLRCFSQPLSSVGLDSGEISLCFFR